VKDSLTETMKMMGRRVWATRNGEQVVGTKSLIVSREELFKVKVFHIVRESIRSVVVQPNFMLKSNGRP